MLVWGGRSDPACGMASGPPRGAHFLVRQGSLVSPSLQSPHPYKGDGCAVFVACGSRSRWGVPVETLRWNLAKTGIAIRRAGGPSSTPPAPVQLACDHIVAMRIVGIAERIQHPRKGRPEDAQVPIRGGFAHQASCRGVETTASTGRSESRCQRLSISSSGTCSADRRRPAGSASSASVRLAVADSSSGPRPRKRVALGKLPAPPALARSAVSSRLLAARVFGVRTVSCSPERAFLRCPGAVTPPAVPLVARSQPRPLPRLGGGSIASRRLACDPRSKDPLATRWPVRSRRHGAGGSPSSPTKARNLAAAWRGEVGRKWGVGAGVASHNPVGQCEAKHSGKTPSWLLSKPPELRPTHRALNDIQASLRSLL
jgi:hypothetical protein